MHIGDGLARDTCQLSALATDFRDGGRERFGRIRCTSRSHVPVRPCRKPRRFRRSLRPWWRTSSPRGCLQRRRTARQLAGQLADLILKPAHQRFHLISAPGLGCLLRRPFRRHRIGIGKVSSLNVPPPAPSRQFVAALAANDGNRRVTPRKPPHRLGIAPIGCAIPAIITQPSDTSAG